MLRVQRVQWALIQMAVDRYVLTLPFLLLRVLNVILNWWLNGDVGFCHLKPGITWSLYKFHKEQVSCISITSRMHMFLHCLSCVSWKKKIVLWGRHGFSVSKTGQVSWVCEVGHLIDRCFLPNHKVKATETPPWWHFIHMMWKFDTAGGIHFVSNPTWHGWTFIQHYNDIHLIGKNHISCSSYTSL